MKLQYLASCRQYLVDIFTYRMTGSSFEVFGSTVFLGSTVGNQAFIGIPGPGPGLKKTIPSRSLTVRPLKRYLPNRKESSSNHHFSGRETSGGRGVILLVIQDAKMPSAMEQILVAQHDPSLHPLTLRVQPPDPGFKDGKHTTNLVCSMLPACEILDTYNGNKKHGVLHRSLFIGFIFLRYLRLPDTNLVYFRPFLFTSKHWTLILTVIILEVGQGKKPFIG